MRCRKLFLIAAILLSSCNISLPTGSKATPTPAEAERTSEPTTTLNATAPSTGTETGAPAGIESPGATATGTLPAPMLSLSIIRMFDPSNGWSMDSQHVYRTENSGVTWVDVTPTGFGEVSLQPTAYFLDINHGWVTDTEASDISESGRLFRTEDGGLSWTTSSFTLGGGLLRFVDAQKGWMMSDLGRATGKNAIAVSVTSNGGATWQRVYHNDPTQSGAGTSPPLGGQKNGFTALTAQKAWIGGATNEPGTVYLYRTTNGGRAWTKQNVPLPADSQDSFFTTEGPVFLSGNEGFLPVIFSGASLQMLFYDTRDGGTTWTLTPGSIPSGRLVDFVSITDGFAWGDKLYVTHDGAQNWTPVDTVPDFGESLAALDFVDGTNGWALVRDVDIYSFLLYATTDGGQNWTKLNPVATSIRTAKTTVYLTLVGDNGQNGDKIGCDDSLVPVEVAVAPSGKDQVAVAVDALLGIRARDYEGKYNGLYLSNLQFVKSSATGNRIIVYLSGQVVSGGECDDPRIIGQIRKTVAQFGFQDITVLVGGRKLEDILSLKGK
jgi:photosystem II stability/assembly factor-like uncharacterized protein